jgi:hypothetical protein
MIYRMPDMECAVMQLQFALRALERGFDGPQGEQFEGNRADLAALFGIFSDYLGAALAQDYCDAQKEREQKAG